MTKNYSTIGIPNMWLQKPAITGESIINRFNRTRAEVQDKSDLMKFQDNRASNWASNLITKFKNDYKKVEEQYKKAASRNKDLANLQLQLYVLGYFPKGTTYEQAVDGIYGKRVLEALQKRDSQQGTAVYLHYPNFNGQAANAFTIGNVDVGKTFLGSGNVLPVGHGELITFDKDGNTTHIRYGRYLKGTGVVRPTVKGGNWKITTFPKRKSEESIQAYLKRVSNQPEMADAKLGKYEAIEIPNVNSAKIILYAIKQSKDAKRPTYGLTNTCATGAENAIKAGMSLLQLNKVNDWTNSVTNIISTSPANNGILLTIYGLIPGSTNRYAADMRKVGKSYIIK